MTLTQLQIKELLDENRNHRCEGFGSGKVCVQIIAIDELPSRFGDFHIFIYCSNRDDEEHVAIVRGDVIGAKNVPVRLHSECLTGDAIGSIRCNCRDQLETALKQIGQLKNGIILYMRQKRSGVELTDETFAYGLHHQDDDVEEPDWALGSHGEEHKYSIAAHMLHSIMVSSIQLITNDPSKIELLIQHGVAVNGIIPLIVPPNPRREKELS